MLRILALPGLWLGLTIVLASLRGVCVFARSLCMPEKLKVGILGVHDDISFGDLRQLRSFELARPSVSSLRPPLTNTAPFALFLNPSRG